VVGAAVPASLSGAGDGWDRNLSVGRPRGCRRVGSGGQEDTGGVARRRPAVAPVARFRLVPSDRRLRFSSRGEREASLTLAPRSFPDTRGREELRAIGKGLPRLLISTRGPRVANQRS